MQLNIGGMVRMALGCSLFFSLPDSVFAQSLNPREYSVEDPGIELSFSDASETSSLMDSGIRTALVQQESPLEPVRRENPNLDAPQPNAATPLANQSEKLRDALLGGVNATSGLSQQRQARVIGPGVDAVLGEEGVFRKTTDSGNLIGKSISVRGVSSQQRTPITTDTRVRAERVGQVLATGSYWAPVRMDLDTMMSKIDSRLINSLLVIKGPYSPRYGPGFSFIDIELLTTPRYQGGFQMHGTSNAEYLTNGQQWYGRQTFFGGSDDWGFRASYGHRTGNDYKDGDGFELPSSYNSRDINIALGWDIDDDRQLEFNYLRLDQTGVEYPGLVFDTRYLVTDGYELKYFDNNPLISDYHTSEVWYNRTRFEGDTLGAGKNRQIPILREVLFSPSGFDGFGVTDGDGSSMGYRSESIFGLPGVSHLAFGTDMIILRQGINDREALLPANDNNFPLPPSQSFDFGFYVEHVLPVNDFVRFNSGLRADTIHTTSTGDADGFDPIYTPDELRQNFTTWTSYSTAEVDLTENWMATAGVGYGQRPPTLTELYVEAAFIGSLQSGLTYLGGDPDLKPETLRQIDFGGVCNYERFTGGANWYYAWIDDYITYDSLTPGAGQEGLTAGAGFVNTNLATLTGVELFGQLEATRSFTFFGLLSYVEGTDRTRNETTYLGDTTVDRSLESGSDVEPLPGIPPLDSRVGVILHDSSPNRLWAIEYSLRAVGRQDRIAATLDEIATPGFVTMDLRGYRNYGNGWLLTGGVENLTDRFYREHLDYRSGLGVFRPGIGFYSGLELNY
ncbi:MAG: TonB-dependent receptor [Planctomycetales bacterium]|nr:TonB-dependent receptor [Planctomycetales bacterium]